MIQTSIEPESLAAFCPPVLFVLLLLLLLSSPAAAGDDHGGSQRGRDRREPQISHTSSSPPRAGG